MGLYNFNSSFGSSSHCIVSGNSQSEVIRLQGKKGIWLKLSVERSDLVPAAVKVTLTTFRPCFLEVKVHCDSLLKL